MRDGDDGDDEDDGWYREQVAGGPSGEERIGDVPEGPRGLGLGGRRTQIEISGWGSNAVGDDDGDGDDAYDDDKENGNTSEKNTN